MRSLYFLPLALIAVLFHSSCKKYQAAPDAFFLVADPVSVKVKAGEGSNNHKITDLFLYLNGKFQGAYPAGNNMPIVSRNASAKIEIFAGIKNNGFKDKTTTWILYNKIQIDTFVEAGKTVRRPITFNYNPNVKFVWLEDFDSQVGFSLVKHPDSDTTFKIITGAGAFEGKSAEFGLTGGGNKMATLQSSTSYTLPSGNPNVYLELTYKANTDFRVGLTDGINFKEALGINPQENWNKIYIQLAETIGTPPLSPNNSYKVYFRMIKTDEMSEARIWLDNIKLIYL